MYETQVALSSALADADDHIEQVREAYHDLEDLIDAEHDGEWEAAPDHLVARRAQYREEWKRAEGLKRVTTETLRRWGGPSYDEGTDAWADDAFTLEMLSGPALAEVEDRVSASGAAMQQDVGVLPPDLSGSRVTETLKRAVVGEPDGIPGASEPPTLSAYPWQVMLWLAGKVDNLNTAGDADFSDTVSDFEAAMARDSTDS